MTVPTGAVAGAGVVCLQEVLKHSHDSPVPLGNLIQFVRSFPLGSMRRTEVSILRRGGRDTRLRVHEGVRIIEGSYQSADILNLNIGKGTRLTQRTLFYFLPP